MSAIRMIRVAATALLITSASCAGILSSRQTDRDSRSDPPRSWSAGIRFMFQDTSSARAAHTTWIEFHDGRAVRVVTNRDLSSNQFGELITPWYRLHAPKDGSLNIRVALQHPGGSRTVADYPLAMPADGFYTVFAAVYQRDPSSPPGIGMPVGLRGYPLHPAASVRPGDSLWIAFKSQSKDCTPCFW